MPRIITLLAFNVSINIFMIFFCCCPQRNSWLLFLSHDHFLHGLHNLLLYAQKYCKRNNNQKIKLDSWLWEVFLVEKSPSFCLGLEYLFFEEHPDIFYYCVKLWNNCWVHKYNCGSFLHPFVVRKLSLLSFFAYCIYDYICQIVAFGSLGFHL